MENTHTLTAASLELFLDLAADAGNWSGMPLFGGNVGGSAADRGNLTDLKVKGLVNTQQDDRGDSWVEFTPAGITLAAAHGIDLSWVL